MVTEKNDVQTLHFEHRLWSNELSFFYDEIAIFEHRLEELAQNYGERDTLAGVEHFQNQFIRQKEVLDQIRHDIGVHEQHLTRLAQANEKISNLDEEKHAKMKDSMDIFRKIYQELKQEFYRFKSQH